MKAIALFLIVSAVIGLGLVLLANKSNMPKNNNEVVGKLVLASPSFVENGLIPRRYTCDGDNTNPPILISSVPTHAKSLVLIMDDPDVPSGLWIHWIKFNIPAGIKAIDEGVEPPGVSGKGTSGHTSYDGPCPPSGTHRYVFKIYALDIMLNLLPGVSKEELESGMAGHILASGELTGLYSRK